MTVISISSGSPHVRCTPMGVHRTCGEPDDIKKNTHPTNITALFQIAYMEPEPPLLQPPWMKSITASPRCVVSADGGSGHGVITLAKRQFSDFSQVGPGATAGRTLVQRAGGLGGPHRSARANGMPWKLRPPMTRPLPPTPDDMLTSAGACVRACVRECGGGGGCVRGVHVHAGWA